LAKQPSASDPLSGWRALFSVEARQRGDELARAGHVKVLVHDGGFVAATVGGRGATREVEIDLGAQRVREGACACPAFTARGACEHLWAVLVVVLGAQREVRDGGAASTALGAWLAGLQRLERESPPDDAPAPAEAVIRVEYVLVLDEAAPGATLLETRRARPLARGGHGRTSPFDLLAPRRDERLAEDDRRIAALLRGAESPVVAPLARTRGESRHRLDAEQTRVLLPHLAATRRLHWSLRGTVSVQTLTLDDGAPWKAGTRLAPAMESDAERDAPDDELRLETYLARGAERVPGRSVRGILAGDFVVLDERVLAARLGRARAWFLLQAREAPPTFPAREAPAVLFELARRELDVEPGPGMERWIEARRPVPHLALAAPHAPAGEDDEPAAEVELALPGTVSGTVSGTVEFDYGVARISATDRRPLLPTGRGVLRRYFEVEQALLARATALGARICAPGTLVLELARVSELVRALEAEGWTVAGEGAKWRALGAPRLAVRSGVDWFEIEGRFEGLASSELPALLAALRRGENSVRLSDGGTGVVPEEWVARWRDALALGEVRGGRLRFRATQAWLLDPLLSDFADRESERLWAEQRERLAEFERLAPAHEPRGFRGELRPYQREGLGWLEFLARQRFGGCLADEMGLGKTVQVLAWLQARKEREPDAAPALIVAPKSLTHNWLEEAQRFTPGLAALEYVATDRRRLRAELARHDLVLTTYGTVRSDVEELAEQRFGVVVLDEAQAIKNEGSRTARSVRLLRAEHRLALSGTPIENHLGELWSLFEFLNPGMLGRSSAFQELAARATPDGAPQAETTARIAHAVRPFLLRRTKEAVLTDLPARSEQTVLCDMEPEQRREYVELRDHFRRELLGKRSDAELRRDKLGILEMLLRLRQAACHPGLLDPARAGEGCAKFDAFFPMLEDVLESGSKALVFSQFTSFLALLRARLDAEKRTYAYLDGSTPAAERAAAVARFQKEREPRLFLISLKAGGTGLNLTAADYVFLLDPWWNPAVEAQAIGRSHRIGQTRRVFAYRLVCRATIEERVLELQEKKRELADSILAGDGRLLTDLTRAELERLLE
jgi:superfamily II DNA or RNA helicase